MSGGRPHDRYFALSEREQRQVQALLAKGAKAGRAPDHAAIEAAIELVLARRAWKRNDRRRDHHSDD